MNQPSRSTSGLPEPYRLQIRVIDHEHGRLFDLLGRLNEKTLDARWILASLVDYADKHFLVEEEFMRAYDYPDLESHKAAHDVFRARVQQLMTDLGISGDVSKTVRVFLESWLVNHIDKLDRKLAQWIHEHP